jgi:seryl-tRNA synthetase
METKEQLVANIKEWIQMDTDISKLKTQLKELQNKKKNVTQELINVMKNNSIDCFDINGGALIYKQNKTKKNINGKMLLNVLQNYYKNDTKTAEDLTKHILDSREEQVKEVIKRRIDK